MTFGFSRDHSNVSKYPRAISSTIISVGLLAVFIILNSWVLYSYPIGSVIPTLFRGADRESVLVSPDSWEGGRTGELDQDDKSNLVASDQATELVQNQDSEDGQSPEVLVFRGNESMPSDSRSEEEAIERPLTSSDTESVDDGDNDVASAPEPGSQSSTVSSGITSDDSSVEECDLYHGQWYYDPAGPQYTNNSCPILSQSQNCLGNGRPDKEYENWRWKPYGCELSRFNATKFLDLMNGKTIAFLGDSLARNQMESLLCLLWQVEVPKNRGSRRMQRWYFPSKSVTIIRIWSAWLVNHSTEPFSYAPDGLTKLYLDIPDDSYSQLFPSFDAVVLSNGHWFPKKAAYVLNKEIVGQQLWTPPEPHPRLNITDTEAYRITTETSLTAMATHPDYSGLTMVMSFTPDHYERGAWNTGGSCTGKVGPLFPGQLVENEYTNTMHQKQLAGVNQARGKISNGSKLKYVDITEVLSYRHDGHPGPFRSPDPNKATKRGPDGRPPPQDCLHWCMPGPVDVMNEFLLEVIRREFEGQ